MWKGHHYIQLPNGKHLFFSESNQANTQGGLSLISQVDSNGNMKSVTILVVWYICHGGFLQQREIFTQNGVFFYTYSDCLSVHV